MSQTHPHTSAYFHSRLLILGALFLILLITGIALLVYIKDVQLYQIQQAETLTTNAARTITRTISRERQVLQAFTDEHVSQLEQLIHSPSNNKIKIHLRQILKDYMPELFGMSIVEGEKGDFLIKDDILKGYIGKTCIHDIHQLILYGKNPLKMHANIFQYHYDLTVPFHTHDKHKYFLFASYTLTPFIYLLKQHQLPGHTLYVVQKTQKGWLIEFNAQGTRQRLTQSKQSIYLSPNQNTLFVSIPGTEWYIADQINSDGLQQTLKLKTRVHILAFWATSVLIMLSLILLLIQRMEEISQQKQQLKEVMAQLKEKNQLLTRQAYIDSLTGLANRRAFDETLRREWYRNARNNTPLSLIMLDIDHFKLWNDSLGHLKGDEILKRIATLLRQQVKRHSDMVARYGGEELAVLLPETDHEAACRLAETIRAAVEALHIRNRVIPRRHLTVSLGVCTCIPYPDLPPDPTLIACADDALYRAKEGGRNRVACNHPQHCQAVEKGRDPHPV